MPARNSSPLSGPMLMAGPDQFQGSPAPHPAHSDVQQELYFGTELLANPSCTCQE